MHPVQAGSSRNPYLDQIHRLRSSVKVKCHGRKWFIFRLWMHVTSWITRRQHQNVRKHCRRLVNVGCRFGAEVVGATSSEGSLVGQLTGSDQEQQRYRPILWKTLVATYLSRSRSKSVLGSIVQCCADGILTDRSFVVCPGDAVDTR